MTLNVSLTPVLVPYSRGDGFNSYFEEYPNAIGNGDTKEDALKSLTNVFAAMVMNEPETLYRNTQ